MRKLSAVWNIADKEILNMTDLEDRIQTTKKISKNGQETKTSVNIIALSILYWLCIGKKFCQ